MSMGEPLPGHGGQEAGNNFVAFYWARAALAVQ